MEERERDRERARERKVEHCCLNWTITILVVIWKFYVS